VHVDTVILGVGNLGESIKPQKSPAAGPGEGGGYRHGHYGQTAAGGLR
jgi:hypothetical protein